VSHYFPIELISHKTAAPLGDANQIKPLLIETDTGVPLVSCRRVAKFMRALNSIGLDEAGERFKEADLEIRRWQSYPVAPAPEASRFVKGWGCRFGTSPSNSISERRLSRWHRDSSAASMARGACGEMGAKPHPG